jgi:hypothetical protein
MILLMAVVTLCGALDFLDEIGRYLFGPSTHFPYLGRDGLLAAIGIIGMATVAYLHRRPAAAGAPVDGNSGVADSHSDDRATGGGGDGEDVPAKERGPERDARRRPLTALLGLEVAAATLYLMDWLYAKALAATTISLWAAAILLVAIAWDITMSGESLTNRSSPQMPRATRVLGFLGYAIALSGTVLFYSDQHTLADGKAVQPYFEPESITQSGLFRIAFPVLVLLLLLKLSGGRGALAAEATEGSAPSPEELHAEAEGTPSGVALAGQV